MERERERVLAQLWCQQMASERQRCTTCPGPSHVYSQHELSIYLHPLYSNPKVHTPATSHALPYVIEGIG